MNNTNIDEVKYCIKFSLAQRILNKFQEGKHLELPVKSHIPDYGTDSTSSW